MEDKYCPRCECRKQKSEFSSNKARVGNGRDGLASYCKACVREYGKQKQYDKARWESNKEYESERNKAYTKSKGDEYLAKCRERMREYRKNNPAKVNAMNRARAKWNFVPSWADKAAMRVLYEKAKQWSEIVGCELQVDHIVPLRGKTVCGLHCEANLQLLAADLNHAKRHFEWPDMPI